MQRECRVFMLPTPNNERSNLLLESSLMNLLHISEAEKDIDYQEIGDVYQYLYVTSHEKIKNGWIIGIDGKIHYTMTEGLYPNVIIATTETTLGIAGFLNTYPTIPKSFLRLYADNFGIVKLTNINVEFYRRGRNSEGNDADLTGGILISKNDYWVPRLTTNGEINISLIKETNWTPEQKKDISKLIHSFKESFCIYQPSDSQVDEWINTTLK